MKILLKDTLKKNNGYTGLDLSVSAIVILISISVIATMFYKLYFAGIGMKRNVVATDYAINILETIQATEYSKVTFNDEDIELKYVLDNLLNIKDNNRNSSSIENSKYIANVNNYTITIKIEKYSDREEIKTEVKDDYIKIITVNIKYNLGKKLNKNVDDDDDTNTEILEISTLKTIN